MRNTYILLIIEAVLTLLLFFSESYLKYVTIILFLIIDLMLFASLFARKWSYEEFLTFAAIICSAIFLILYIFAYDAFTILLGVGIMLLYIIIAMLEYNSAPAGSGTKIREDELVLPRAPSQVSQEPYAYDVEYEPEVIRPVVVSQKQPAHKQTQRPTPSKTVPKPEAREIKTVKDNTAAKAVAYELEREVSQLKDAEKLVKNLEVYNAERELLKESAVMQNVQKQMDIAQKSQKLQKTAELKREAAEMKKVQKQISDIKRIQQKQELSQEAKSLQNAEQKIKQVQFLNQQEKMVSQAKSIANAQKEIDRMNKKIKKSIPKKVAKQKKAKPKTRVIKVKTVHSKDESFYFATDKGNTFHEPGCLSIKKVPKNKLTLFTSRKDAMRKGLQPCRVCIPK